MTYLAKKSAVGAERSIDHIGSEKTPIRIVQQWGILVNGLTAEPATRMRVWLEATWERCNGECEIKNE